MTTTEKFSNEKIVAQLEVLSPVLSEDTIVRAEYDILYVNYSKAKQVYLKKLRGTGREVRSFPIYDDMKNILWTVAEFTSNEGERLEFRREGYTSIEVTYYCPNDIAEVE